MQIGKNGGEHFVLSFTWNYGFSFFVPATRNSWAFAFGMGWRVMSDKRAEFRPHVSFIVVRNPYPFCRMWHLRWPFNVVRVGTVRAPI